MAWVAAPGTRYYSLSLISIGYPHDAVVVQSDLSYSQSSVLHPEWGAGRNEGTKFLYFSYVLTLSSHMPSPSQNSGQFKAHCFVQTMRESFGGLTSQMGFPAAYTLCTFAQSDMGMLCNELRRRSTLMRPTMPLGMDVTLLFHTRSSFKCFIVPMLSGSAWSSLLYTRKCCKYFNSEISSGKTDSRLLYTVNVNKSDNLLMSEGNSRRKLF